ncbi:MAG: hypothetical protein ABF649_03240 [Bacillus sp. (in: firmicutes)]
MENILDSLFFKIEAYGNEQIEISIDELNVIFLTRSEFEEGQTGFRFDLEGNSLIGDSDGSWKKNWYVIGFEEDIGDPIIIDITSEDSPIMIAEHGTGEWQPKNNLSKFNGLFKE